MDPDYENTIRRLGSEIGKSNQADISSLVPTQSRTSFIKPVYIYIAIPIAVLVILLVWSPLILHVELPNADHGDMSPPTKLNKTRLLLCTVVVSSALIGGWYMYNIKRKFHSE
jgi:predicted secreted protein